MKSYPMFSARRRFWFVSAVPLLLLWGCAGSRPPAVEPGPLEPGDAPLIRVGLLVQVDEVQIGATESFALTDDSGVLVVGLDTEVFSVRREGDQLMVYTGGTELVDSAEGVLRVEPRTAHGEVTVNGARYPRQLEVRAGPETGLVVINILDVETYLQGVVPLEIGHRAEDFLEAAKAQAVAARTYVASHLGQYPELGFDLHAGVLDQVYGPVDRRHPDADRAVHETRGLILVHDNQPIRANYASTCGGKTAAVEESFNADPIPYLKAHDDKLGGKEACRTSKYFRWDQTWSGAELVETLSKTIPRVMNIPWSGNWIRDLKVLEAGKSDRVTRLLVETDKTRYEIEKGLIRRVLETPQGRPLWSTAFEVELWRRGEKLNVVMLRGRGWGHGVGMCQWGAMQLSQEGYLFQRILEHYYPGTKLRSWYPGARISRLFQETTDARGGRDG